MKGERASVAEITRVIGLLNTSQLEGLNQHLREEVFSTPMQTRSTKKMTGKTTNALYRKTTIKRGRSLNIKAVGITKARKLVFHLIDPLLVISDTYNGKSRTFDHIEVAGDVMNNFFNPAVVEVMMDNLTVALYAYLVQMGLQEKIDGTEEEAEKQKNISAYDNNKLYGAFS